MALRRVLGFDEANCKRIARSVRKSEKAPGVPAIGPRPRQAVPNWQGFFAKTRAGGVPAISGNTPGSATVDFYALASGVLTATGDSAAALNLSAAAVGASKWVVVCWVAGNLVVLFEDCT